MTEAYVALGMPREDARVSAWGVVIADLRGHESHGVSNNVFGLVCAGPALGRHEGAPEHPDPPGDVGDVALGRRPGHGLRGRASKVMNWCIERAKEHGAAFAAVANSRHYGMAQCYSIMALEHDLIGYSLTNGVTPGVVPFQGRESRLGTNPISIAIPAGREAPYVLDMATTTVAFGKLQNYQRDGKPIPPTYALGRDGRPTTDPAEAIAAVRLLPLGANKEGSGHKGYGLGLMVDIFCGGLSGHGFRATADDPEAVSHFFGAWRPDAFLPLDQFKSLMDGRLREMMARRRRPRATTACSTRACPSSSRSARSARTASRSTRRWWRSSRASRTSSGSTSTSRARTPPITGGREGGRPARGGGSATDRNRAAERGPGPARGRGRGGLPAASVVPRVV